MSKHMPLVLEVNARHVPDQSSVAPGLMITPPVGDDDYWLARVKVSATQAVVAFPKFGVIGVGFHKEIDWNTNLPADSGPERIWEHIKHNRAGVKAETCKTALAMVCAWGTAQMAERKARAIAKSEGK